MTPTSESIKYATQALARFFAFFCALAVTIAVALTIALWIRPSTISDGSTAIAVFGLTSLVAALLMVIAAIASAMASAGRFSPGSPAGSGPVP